MRAVGYIRVSTEEQARDGISLDAQKAKIEAYAKLYGIELVSVEVDAGISAKTLDRPGVQSALSMLSAGTVDGLLIAKLDRLTRSVRDWATLIDEHFGERVGRHLWSVGDSINTTSAGGRLVLNVLMSVAQWEREVIQERTQAALDHKRSLGQVVRHVPFGSRLAADGVTLEPDPADAETLATIAKLRADGHPFRSIAAQLDRLGIRPKNGGACWAASTVHKLFTVHKHAS